MKEYWCNCVDWNYGVNKLSNLIDSGIETTASDFFEQCIVDDETRQMFDEYPDDFMFYRNPKGNIYWFTHSAIEHFYRRLPQ